MTPLDRSKLARIVAYGLSLGQSPAELERRLAEYAPGALPEDIDAALEQGTAGSYLAARATAGDEEGFAESADLELAAGAVAFDVLVKYRIGPDAVRDWRTVTFPAASVADVATLQAEAMAAARAQLAREPVQGSDPRPRGAALVEESLTFVFVVPRMGE